MTCRVRRLWRGRGCSAWWTKSTDRRAGPTAHPPLMVTVTAWSSTSTDVAATAVRIRSATSIIPSGGVRGKRTQEFLSSPTSGDVASAQLFPYSVSDLDQYEVSSSVSQGVVDILEVIDVESHFGRVLSDRWWRVDCPLGQWPGGPRSSGDGACLRPGLPGSDARRSAGAQLHRCAGGQMARPHQAGESAARFSPLRLIARLPLDQGELCSAPVKADRAEWRRPTGSTRGIEFRSRPGFAARQGASGDWPVGPGADR